MQNTTRAEWQDGQEKNESITRTSRGSLLLIHAEDTNTISKPRINSNTNFQKPAQAERTKKQYKEESSVDTKIYSIRGIKYPYDKVINFVSNFPFGFKFFGGEIISLLQVQLTAKNMIQRWWWQKVEIFVWTYGLINHVLRIIFRYGT